MSHEVKAENKRSFRHDRKCGEWLKENVKQGNLNTLKQNVESNNVLPSVTLASLNVSKNESSRLQKIADIPDKCNNLLSLQDAYKQIETIEAQAKLTLEMLTGICFDEHTEINNVNDFR